MKRIPHKTLIFHWVEGQGEWSEIPWPDWVRFRGLSKERSSLLRGAEPGDHYFVVCMLGTYGELCNVIPHRYVISADARLVHGFDGLEIEEREESDRIEELPCPTIEEIDRYNELGARGFAVNLPPAYTVQHLLHTIPGIAGAQPGAACWDFLFAIGVCRSSTRAN
jgi:hypothetical protein